VRRRRRRGRHTPGGPRASARQTPEEYRALSQQCRDAIRAGDAYQLCLTTRFTVAASTPFDPVSTYLALRDALPAHHGGIIRSGTTRCSARVPSASSRSLTAWCARPIKGTGRAAATPTMTPPRRALVDSVKERAENVMIVDLMRNDLRGAGRGRSAPNVCSRWSRIRRSTSWSAPSRAAPAGRHLGHLLDAAFPAGSMTGAPKLSAMTILSALEGEAGASTRGASAGSAPTVAPTWR
jgi:anthranilate synthase component 1